jgi:ketosteroid isomerase-like protein
MGANAKLVEQAYSAFGRGDIPGLLELLDEYVEWTSPRTLPQGGEYHGRGEVLKFFEAVGGAWNDLTLDVECVGEAGSDLVVGVVRADGQRDGRATGYGATQLFNVREGKITRFREYVDIDQAIRLTDPKPRRRRPAARV